MPIYRCDFLDFADHLVTSKIVDCETDDAIQETADILLAACDYSRVEVWEHGRQVYRAQRGAPQPSFRRRFATAGCHPLSVLRRPLVQ
jgi:hypothetical protein